MKLVVMIVQDQDVSDLTDRLRESDYMFTKLHSTGGFLRSGNTTLLVGTEDEKVSQLLDMVHGCCKSRRQAAPTYNMLDGELAVSLSHAYEVTVGGATVFVLDVEQFYKF